MLLYVLALAAAAFLGIGFVLQQRAAAEAPLEHGLSPRLLGDLLQRPMWLLGIATMVVGQLLGAAALGIGTLVLVEPLLTANLLFALVFGALWRRGRPRAREWVGAVLLSLGVGIFVAAANPHGGNVTGIAWWSWAIALGSVAACAFALAWWGSRGRGANQAILYSVAAGALYGLQDALTRRTLRGAGHFGASVLTSWAPYALVATAVIGLLIAQSAFQHGPIHVSLPGITITEPVTGIALGAGLFDSDLRVATAALAVEITGLAIMVVGMYLVSRSPIMAAAGAASGASEPPVAAAES